MKRLTLTLIFLLFSTMAHSSTEVPDVTIEYNRASVTARLTLCNTPSRSYPVIVNIRYSLSSFTEQPVSIHVKTGTLYHEILHGYIENNLPKRSTLLELYRNENPRVVEHLHSIALLKAVYLKLQLTDQLSSLIEVDNYQGVTAKERGR